MPFDAPGGDLIFMNDADQELYLVPPHLEEVFQEYSERNSESEDPLVIAKYFIP